MPTHVGHSRPSLMISIAEAIALVHVLKRYAGIDDDEPAWRPL